MTGTRAHLAQHDTTGARDWLARVSELLLERRIPGTLGALDHAQGLIHLHEGQTGKARICLARAAEFWSARERFWEGTAVLVDQARCATRSRRPADAALFQARAREAYALVGAHVPDLAVRAAGVVRPVSGFARVAPGSAASGPASVGPASDGPHLPGPHLPVPHLPGPDLASSHGASPDGLAESDSLPGGSLSARELEVARLVATGATNREIAAALTIAPKTVAAHIEHILTKLGVARRAQIAAWVATHG